LALVYVCDSSKWVLYEDVAEDIVILAPTLYWFQVCSIPTKNLTKAKKIALHMMSEKPSSFESIALMRHEQEYFAYAYEKKSIEKIVKELALQNPKIYFANQLHLRESVAVDSEISLYSFAKRVMESHKKEQPQQTLKTSYKELLEGEKPLDGFAQERKKQGRMAVATLGLFVLYVLLFSVDRVKTISAIDKKLASLNTQRSSYEIKALIRKYKKLDADGKKLRKDFQEALEKSDGKKVEVDE